MTDELRHVSDQELAIVETSRLIEALLRRSDGVAIAYREPFPSGKTRISYGGGIPLALGLTRQLEIYLEEATKRGAG
jgi:hypothetical protein